MICNDLKFQRLKYFLKFQSNNSIEEMLIMDT